MSTVTSVHLLYFRVKELRRDRDHNDRRIYPVPLATHNLSSKKNGRDSIGIATQGKKLCKIQNLNRVQVLCCTKKKSGDEKDAFASTRQGKRPGQFAWNRDSQRKCVNGEKIANGREVKEKHCGKKAKNTNHERINKIGMLFGKATTKKLIVPILGKTSDYRNSEKENQQFTCTEDNENGHDAQREFIKIRGEFCAEEEFLSEMCLQGFHERDKDRKHRLRQYHQRLQECWPLSASSSHRSFSEQTCYPATSRFRQEYNISAHNMMDTDSEKDLRRLSVWIGQNNESFDVKSEDWKRDQDDEAEVGAGDLSVSSNDSTVLVELGIEAGYRNLHKTQEQKAKERDCYAGKKRQGVRLAWAIAPEVAQMDIGTEVKKDYRNGVGNNSNYIQNKEIDCLSTVSSGCISEAPSVLLFQTGQRIEPNETPKQNNFQHHPLENRKGVKNDNEGLLFLSCQENGMVLNEKSDALHCVPNCSEKRKNSHRTTLLKKDEAQMNSKPQWETLPSPTTVTQQDHVGHSKQAGQSKLSPWLKTVAESRLGVGQITPTKHLCTREDLHHAQ